MRSRGIPWSLLLVLSMSHGCSWYPSLKPGQVVTQDAYKTANQVIHRIAEPFKPLSVAERAVDRRRPVRYAHGLLLIDDGASMQEPAPGFTGNRVELAVELTDRLAATLAMPAPQGEPAALTWIALETGRVSALADGRDDALSAALTRLESQLQGGTDTALVLFSRADRIAEDTVRTVRGMQSRYGERFCLHLVSVGDNTACFRLRDFNTCGSAVRGEDIADPKTMAAYALKLFYGDPLDTDGDGIYDYRDQCPDTPSGSRINWDGCPFDEAALRSLLPD
jgi:hypothetical protein